MQVKLKAFCWFTVIQNKINNLSIKLARIKNSITISPLHSGVNRRVINIMSLLNKEILLILAPKKLLMRSASEGGRTFVSRFPRAHVLSMRGRHLKL